MRSDVRDALLALGYGPDEVAAALRDLDLPDEGTDADVGALVRAALRSLGARR